MYRSVGFSTISSDCKWDRSSAPRYLLGLKETTSYLYGYSKVRTTHPATYSLYIIPI